MTQTPGGVQFVKPKAWSTLGLVLIVALPLLGGLLWRPLLGVAAVGLGIVLVDYLLKPDAVAYVSVAEARALAESRLKAVEPPSR